MRHFGIFKLTYDTYRQDGLAAEKRHYTEILLKDGKTDPWFIRAGKVYGDHRDPELVSCLHACREAEKRAARTRRGPGRFKTTYVIHQTDEDGWWLPSKAEEKQVRAALDREA